MGQTGATKDGLSVKTNHWATFQGTTEEGPIKWLSHRVHPH